MQKYVKFLQRLPKHLREKLIAVVQKIAADDLKNLDIKRLVGRGNFYRCRVGQIRIIFEKRNGENIVQDVGFRGNIYN